MVVMEDKNRGFPLKNIAWNTPTYMHKNFRPSFAQVYLALAYTRTLPSTRSKFPWLLLPHDKPCMISLFSSKENRLAWPVVCFPFNFLPLCTYIHYFLYMLLHLIPYFRFFSSSIHPLNALYARQGRQVYISFTVVMYSGGVKSACQQDSNFISLPLLLPSHSLHLFHI